MQNNNNTLFSNLYHSYKRLVYNLALHYTQNVEDSEEISQDVFVAVYEKLDRFRAEAELKTWIYRITINKSLDFIRSKKRQKRFGRVISLFKNDGNSLDIAQFNHPGIELENKEQLALLFRAVNSLPEKQKTALILLKIEHRTQAETACIMELSEKAVESLFQRAKINLKKKLNENEGI